MPMCFPSMISFNPFDAKTVIPSLQMKELQFKEVKWLAQMSEMGIELNPLQHQGPVPQ